MADMTITGANSACIISIPGLYPTGVQLQDFSENGAWRLDTIDFAEVRMGVDGRMTAGFVPKPTTITYSCIADGRSKDVFLNWVAAMKTSQEIFYATMTISLPSTHEVYTLSRGVLTSGHQMPSFQTVLESLDFTVTWESITRSLTG
jgi:hypothetical protein